MVEAKKVESITIERQWFIDSHQGNIKDTYYFEKKLGSGGYGAVYLAKHKKTGVKVAVKAMQKGRIQDYEAFKNEIAILKQLDHPNIIKLHETWETERICFLITEVCEGGELFYHITKQKFLTEQQAATIIKQAFYALCYLHKSNICHRDIKPENFLLYKENDDSHIKLIDFGLAKKVSKNELMTTPNGTPYYIAPEVLKGSYTTQCDNWSMGVVLFIMLSGRPPFGGKNNNEILHNVLHGKFDFTASVWQQISEEAKDLISNLLHRQADMRFTAEEAFQHPWIQRQRNKEEQELIIPIDVIKNMSSYIDSQNFKRTTLTLIASRIPEDQIKVLRDTFSQFDKNGDGQLTSQELKIGIRKIPGCTMTDEDVDNLMSVMDSNRNGFIDYTEFIAGCLQSTNYLKENHLKSAFAYYDKDSNGNICLDELKQCLQSEELTLPDSAIEKLMKEVDSNKDGIIDYNEFIIMMKKNTDFQQSLQNSKK